MKRTLVSLIVSIVLCSGCGHKQAPPLILNAPDCPAPAPPALPEIDGSAPLDSSANVERLMERDDRIRAHIDGLNAALRCFQAGRTSHGNQ